MVSMSIYKVANVTVSLLLCSVFSPCRTNMNRLKDATVKIIEAKESAQPL